MHQAGLHNGAAWASPHIALGGSYWNSLLLTPNERVPTPQPPSQILSEKEMLPSQGYTSVLLRHSLTQVDSTEHGTRWHPGHVFWPTRPLFLEEL